jgi:hypothetical protein
MSSPSPCPKVSLIVDENHGNSPETITEIPHPVRTAAGQ